MAEFPQETFTMTHVRGDDLTFDDFVDLSISDGVFLLSSDNIG